MKLYSCRLARLFLRLASALFIIDDPISYKELKKGRYSKDG